MYKGVAIELDENEALFGVSAIINDRRKELMKFDLETAHIRKESKTL